MKDSPLDSGNSAWGIVDGDFTSWYGLDDWDDGATYPDAGGVRVTFDAVYEIGAICLTQIEEIGLYQNVRVFAHDDSGREYIRCRAPALPSTATAAAVTTTPSRLQAV